MDTAVRTAVECVVALADEHASAFIECMSQATTLEELHAALSGSFLAFLADVARLTSDG